MQPGSFRHIRKAMLPVVFAGPAVASSAGGFHLLPFVTLDTSSRPGFTDLGGLIQREGGEVVALTPMFYQEDGGGVLISISLMAPVWVNFAFDIKWQQWPGFFLCLSMGSHCVVSSTEKGAMEDGAVVRDAGHELLVTIAGPVDEYMKLWTGELDRRQAPGPFKPVSVSTVGRVLAR